MTFNPRAPSKGAVTYTGDPRATKIGLLRATPSPTTPSTVWWGRQILWRGASVYGKLVYCTLRVSPNFSFGLTYYVFIISLFSHSPLPLHLFALFKGGFQYAFSQTHPHVMHSFRVFFSCLLCELTFSFPNLIASN